MQAASDRIARKSMKPFSIAAWLLASFSLVAYAQQTAPVSVSVTTETPSVPVGGEIKIKITVSNRSDRNLDLLRGPDGKAEAVNDVQVYDAANKSLSRIHGPHGWISRRAQAVEPGGVIENYLILDKLFDMSKPGRYKVVVRHELIQHSDPDSPSTRMLVPSAPLTVIVTE